MALAPDLNPVFHGVDDLILEINLGKDWRIIEKHRLPLESNNLLFSVKITAYLSALERGSEIT